MGSATSLLNFAPHHVSELHSGFTYCTPYSLGRTQPTVRFAYPSALPHCSNRFRWYWNFNQLSIAYGYSPRLRSRLTLSGRSFLRKPWVFGGQDSHLTFRYSYRHSHFLAVHMSLRSYFYPLGTLPYQMHLKCKFIASVTSLSPVGLSARSHLTSELLRTL